jgi:hypothetical protein
LVLVKRVCVWWENTMVRPKVDWWYKRLQEAITWEVLTQLVYFFWDHWYDIWVSNDEELELVEPLSRLWHSKTHCQKY